MIDNVKISVVIPTHNRSALLSAAVNSVLTQTFSDLELIVVNDHSSDDTVEVVRAIPDERIKLVNHNGASGGSAARNTGIIAARGSYIAFLDDDDEWVPEKLEEQLRDSDGFDAVLCGAIQKGANRVDRSFPDHDVTPDVLRRGFIYAGGTSNIMLRRGCATENLFDETLPNGQDWDFLIRLSRSYKVRYMHRPLVIYNDGGHVRITNRPRGMAADQLENRLKVVYKHRALLGDYWFKYHIARLTLSHLNSRQDKYRQLRKVIGRCGLSPTTAVMIDKMNRSFRRRFL